MRLLQQPCAGLTGLKAGGGKRDRTADLLHAMQALYQLSYTPEIWWRIRDSNPGHKDYDSSALTD